MEELRWSVDEQKYDDRDSHTLILDGWYADPEGRDYTFVLYCDEVAEVLPVFARYERPDVAKALEQFADIRRPGFTVKIADAWELAGRHQVLELFLEYGREKISIWKIESGELRRFCEECLIEYHIDREEVLYDTMLEIEGWVLDQRGIAEVSAVDESGAAFACRLSRGRRPDVVERRNLDACYQEQEIGFRVSARLEDIAGKKVILRFRGENLEKSHETDIKKLRRENKSRVFWGRLTGFSNADTRNYEAWFKRHAVNLREAMRQRRTVFPYAPLISIVVPLYNTPLPYLKELIDSIRKQTYANWQLCLADGSEGEEIREYLKKNYGRERRLYYKKLKKNGGISGNTNAAVHMARGEYIMLCDHDDIVTADALFEIVKALNKNRRADVVYTDEDKVSMDGQHYFEPNFKPDFNLFRFRENNYICHIFAVKRELLEKAGLFRPEFDGAQDYDLIFRCCEKAERIVHIPKVLYHWRCHMESTAADPESKRYAYEAGRRAVEEHYERMGIPAEVELTERPGWYRSRVKIQGKPMVSIIIPNKDHTGDLNLCLSSIYEKSTYQNFEILIVENNSEKPETFAYYEEISGKYPRLQVLTWKKEFNFAAINNFAAEQAKGEYLLFLNNDVEIITPRWLEEMLQLCQQEQVGMVGAKLYYPDNTIQHAGVVLGLGGIAGHIMCRASREDAGYMGRMVSVQEISAVTAACMMIKTQTFFDVEGFDETFCVAFNDIDLCMKVRAKKKKIVFTPYAELYHYESKSRGMEDTPEKQFRFDKEVKRFEEKWAVKLAKGDPYYSPNLSVTEGDCSLRED